MSRRRRAKPICFYLPQFHRIPENDAWWGEGFTEWSLVKKAKTAVAGSRQPAAPHPDLGWYDLTDPRVRRRQGEIARRYGVYGFCYYHYWFAGKRLLETPLELMLDDGYPDLPFCLCWANEPWTRTWSGDSGHVLQAQRYGGRGEWVEHFRVLRCFLEHPNAITVEGRPLLLIYRPGHVERLEEMVECWRTLAAEAGMRGLYLAGVLGNFADNRRVPACLDAGVEHHPGIAGGSLAPLTVRGVRVFAMEKLWSELAGRGKVHPVQFPGACMHWDNTPRRRVGSSIYTESTPGRSAGFLADTFQRAAADQALPEPFVFINSWNEWSEGTYIEPDQASGYARLETVRRALREQCTEFKPFPRDRGSGQTPSPGRIDVDALYALISSGLRGERVLEVGCRDGATGAYAGPFLGASHYHGTDDDETRVAAAAGRLHQARQQSVDTFRPETSVRDPEAGRYHLVLAFEDLARAVDPAAAAAGLYRMLIPGGRIIAGFFNRDYFRLVLERGGHAAEPAQERHAGPVYSVREAASLLEGAGFRFESLYRVFNPSPPDPAGLRGSGNRVQLGGVQFGGLSRRQVENLHCLRFFLVASRAHAGRTAEREGYAGD